MHANFHWCVHFGIVRELTARMEPEYLVSTDLANVCDNTSPSLDSEKQLVFLTQLVVARIVVCVTQME